MASIAEELRALALNVRWADGICDVPPSKTVEAIAARVEAIATEIRYPPLGKGIMELKTKWAAELSKGGHK